MKLKSILFTAAIALAGLSKAQTAQHDSLRIHIEENKNGNVVVIDTAVAASQHDQLMLWLTSQGIEIPSSPGDLSHGDSLQMVIVNVEEEDGDSAHSGMRMRTDMPPLPPIPPLPPNAPQMKKCVKIIVLDSSGNKTVSSPEKIQSNQNTSPDPKMVVVFPNPSNGHITVDIDMPGKGKTNLSVSDMNGKVVYSEQLPESTGKISKEIDLSKNGKGTYNIEVKKDGRVIVNRVIVQ